QSLNIELVFRPGSELPEEVVVDLSRRSDEWNGSISLASHDHTFAGSTTIDVSGLLRAKAKFRFPDGPWIYDSSPYAYFLVDPAATMEVRSYTFYPGSNGTIREGWIPSIRRIAQLGYNTIHLLPVTKMGPSQSPYSAADLFQIDPAYSHAQNPEDRMDEFREFVAECIKHGVRICIDLVMNHVAVESVIANKHPDWLAEDPSEADGIKRSGWHDGHKWHKWEDLAFLNYKGFSERTRSGLWEYITKYALTWSSFAAETGGMIRLDNLHSSSPEFMRAVLQEIRRNFPDIVVFAELFTTEEKTVHLTFEYGLNLLLATTWEHKFVPQLRRYLEFIHSGNTSLRYLSPVTTHDSRTPTQEFGNVRSTIPRLVMATLMSPGPSGIVQGVEMGLPEKMMFVGAPKKREFLPTMDFSDLARTLNSLLDRMPFLSTPGKIRFIDRDHQAVLGAIRGEPDYSLLVCANFDTGNEQQIELPGDLASRIANRKLKNELSGRDVSSWLKGSVLSLPAAGCIAIIIS
ncbi:MAG: hypothetical protein HN368_23070, partial [Spirochaetales bacterium]|nr:hypothetical protein [Spirochaetales bacterium]